MSHLVQTGSAKPTALATKCLTDRFTSRPVRGRSFDGWAKGSSAHRRCLPPWQPRRYSAISGAPDRAQFSSDARITNSFPSRATTLESTYGSSPP
jgi:hypothetical protein